MKRALYETRLPGITTNIPFVLRVLDDARFLGGDYDTSIGEDLPPAALDQDDVVPVVAAALAKFRRVPKAVIPAHGPLRDLPAWVRADREGMGR
jgi:acetyl/propionyl-CoA carboxylase alpha subunit